MSGILSHNISIGKQSLYSILIIGIVAGLCFPFSNVIDYRIVAFILLVIVSIIASVFDILPVLLTAVLSALIWDYFFIPPHYTFHISSTEDAVLFLMYFVIVLINGMLTYKIRQIEKKLVHKEEKANTIKLYNTLLNSLSHELRTPIATIIGATDNLTTNNENLSQKNKTDLINEISKASFRLNQQVENLLNMSRLESGIIRPKNDWCDINEIIYNTVSRIEENIITQKIIINVNPEIPYFKLDKGMLEQILYNLLNNACLYTPANSEINIIAICHIETLQIIVEDNGKGFPEEEIEKVFDKFYRLKHSRTGGTGLGLSIIKGFTEAQGGKVTLKNKETGGAQFTIEIPAETSYLNNLNNE